jgi:hypothetical protein
VDGSANREVTALSRKLAPGAMSAAISLPSSEAKNRRLES